MDLYGLVFETFFKPLLNYPERPLSDVRHVFFLPPLGERLWKSSREDRSDACVSQVRRWSLKLGESKGAALTTEVNSCGSSF